MALWRGHLSSVWRGVSLWRTANRLRVRSEVISSKLIASYQVHRRYLQTGLRLGSDNPNAKMAHALELGAYLALGF